MEIMMLTFRWFENSWIRWLLVPFMALIQLLHIFLALCAIPVIFTLITIWLLDLSWWTSIPLYFIFGGLYAYGTTLLVEYMYNHD